MCVYFLSGGEYALFIYCSFISVLFWDPIIKGEGWDSINKFNPATCCDCPMPGHGFPTAYVLTSFFFFKYLRYLFVCLMVFNTTFNNISVISWWSVLMVEEPGENHWPVISHWQTLSHNVVHIALIEIQTHNISGNRHW